MSVGSWLPGIKSGDEAFVLAMSSGQQEFDDS